ncbi:MAG: phosphoadenosine phosphosulfate reductase family protein [Candidatus Nanopelagicaceae bacterium]
MLSLGTGVKAPWLSRKVARADSVIADWLGVTGHNVYASISGGKDSLVACDLIRRAFPECPFVWVNQGPLAEWPDCVELLETLKERGWNIVELCPPRSLLNLYKDYGLPLDGTMATALDKKINTALMYGPLDDYQEFNSIQGYAWGLRKESKGRTLCLKSKGELYQRKDGLWVCSPVGFWSTQDIWNYIDARQLPYAAIYDRDRMTVRNGPPIGTTGVNWGRLSDLRRYHPDLFAQFVEFFPEVANHA